eukprot:4605109-Prymnesium_polylepis.1
MLRGLGPAHLSGRSVVALGVGGVGVLSRAVWAYIGHCCLLLSARARGRRAAVGRCADYSLSLSGSHRDSKYPQLVSQGLEISTTQCRVRPRPS